MVGELFDDGLVDSNILWKLFDAFLQIVLLVLQEVDLNAKASRLLNHLVENAVVHIIEIIIADQARLSHAGIDIETTDVYEGSLLTTSFRGHSWEG